MGSVRKFFASSIEYTLASKSSQAKILLASLLLALSAAAFGADGQQKTLDFIDFKKLPNNSVEIRIALSGKAPSPTDFTSKNPARISLDLPSVNNNLPWSLPLPIDVGVAKNIKAVQAKGRTRVIISVDKLVAYQLRTENKNIFLTLSNSAEKDDPPATATAPKSAPATKAKPVLVAKAATKKRSSTATGPSLQKITFTSLPGDSVQIRMAFSGPVSNPGNFTINNPARIVLDFPKISSALGWKNKNIGIGLAKSITAVEAGNRTRVILNLVQLIPFESEVSGNNVIVTLAGSRTAASATSSSLVTSAAGAANATTGLHRINNIDFRRGKKGEGRIIVSLSDEDTPISTGESGQQIFVEFGDTGLPANLLQRLDVIDFATPVQYIDITQTGDKVRLAITPLGDYEYLAYHTAGTYTIEVKEIPKEKQDTAKKNAFDYTGEKLSLNFQDIEIRAVLQLIADFTNLNMVTSDSVGGNLTLRLKNVPWDQALDIILKTKGLAMRKAGNVILVAPAAEIAAQEKLELEANIQIEELAPLRTELIQVNFAKATELAELLKAKGGIISSRASISVDQRTNTLIISDTAERLEEASKLVIALDIPVRQVLIEARIVIADDDFAKDLGVRFGVTSQDITDPNQQGFSTGTIEGTDTMLLGGGVTGPSPTQRMNVNMPIFDTNAGRIAFSLLGANTLLDLELSALQTENRGEVLSNPRVITSNQHMALIQQGTEIPYREASSSGAATVSFKEAVLALEVTPQITPDDRIILDLQVNKDSVGTLFGGIPSIDTKEIQTQVLMNNGETVVLGGIYEQNTRNDVERVPFFGEIPILGALFRSTHERSEKSELLIFVTPKILKQELTSRK